LNLSGSSFLNVCHLPERFPVWNCTLCYHLHSGYYHIYGYYLPLLMLGPADKPIWCTQQRYKILKKQYIVTHR
jgi:hypothetical protein